MRIKKVKSTKNEYSYAGDVWVRNFTKPDAKPVLEDNLIDKEDHFRIINNECRNKTINLENISELDFNFKNVVIVSNGFRFQELHKLLIEIKEPVCIIAVNKVVKKWELLPDKPINFFIVNNPYEECMFDMPAKYFPPCVASTRTNYDFVNQYHGLKYLYEPTHEKNFGFKSYQKYYIDDYRNPISAALCLSYRFYAQKIMLFCCDDSFEQQKDGAVQLKNKLWTYPQHIRAQNIIDAQCYWLKKAKISVGNYSSGIEYENAAYISTEEQVKLFFKEEE